jgi:hypothetical protein
MGALKIYCMVKYLSHFFTRVYCVMVDEFWDFEIEKC